MLCLGCMKKRISTGRWHWGLSSRTWRCKTHNRYNPTSREYPRSESRLKLLETQLKKQNYWWLQWMAYQGHGTHSSKRDNSPIPPQITGGTHARVVLICKENKRANHSHRVNFTGIKGGKGLDGKPMGNRLIYLWTIIYITLSSRT